MVMEKRKTFPHTATLAFCFLLFVSRVRLLLEEREAEKGA
jgi:hypothetical protein